MFKVKFSPI